MPQQLRVWASCLRLNTNELGKEVSNYAVLKVSYFSCCVLRPSQPQDRAENESCIVTKIQPGLLPCILPFRSHHGRGILSKSLKYEAARKLSLGSTDQHRTSSFSTFVRQSPER